MSKHWAVHAEVVGGDEVQFANRDEVQKYLDRVTTYLWFRQRWPGLAGRVSVTARARTRATASIWLGQINLPNPKTQRWAYSESTVIHELAHCCAGSDCAPHGPRFYRTMLYLIEKTRGQEAALRFRQVLVESGQSLVGEVARYENGPIVKDPPPVPKPQKEPTKKGIVDLHAQMGRAIRANDWATVTKLATWIQNRAATKDTAAADKARRKR